MVETSFSFTEVLIALASIVSVIVGYYLSKLSEKREWRRTKTEQLRDRQIETLLNFLMIIEEATDQLAVISNRIEEEQEQNRKDAVSEDFLMNAEQFDFDSTAQRLRELKENAQRETKKLRLLGLDDPGITIVESVSDQLGEASRNLRAIQLNDVEDLSDSRELINEHHRRLTEKNDELVKIAEDSLSDAQP